MNMTTRQISKYIIATALATGLYAIMASSLASAQQGVVTADNPETRPPVLAVVQDNTALSVVASDDNLDSSTWQAAGPFSQEPICDSDGLVYGAANPNVRFLTLTPADNGKWYCFKVADTDNNYGYAKFEVLGVMVEELKVEEETDPETLAPLTLIASQSGSSITLATNRSAYTGEIQALLVGSSSDCHFQSFERYSRSVIVARQVSGLSWRDNGKWYCFRAADTNGSYAYAAIGVAGLPVPAGVSDNQTSGSAEEEASVETEEDASVEAEVESEDEGQVAAENENEDGDENDEVLRLVGIIVAVVGIIAIIVVIFFSKRQSTPELEGDDDDF